MFSDYTSTQNRWTYKSQIRQLFQVITIEKNYLLYKAFDVIGNIFDSFKLIKKIAFSLVLFI